MESIAQVLGFAPQFTAVTCPTCGVEFGLSPAMAAQRQADGARVHCPNGHGLTFSKQQRRQRGARG